jgi:DnaJ-class molecular chaperone
MASVQDPYDVLGVPRDAAPAAIRAAYRKLAKKFHPDLNPGNADAAERFKTINAANDLLSDPEKRARFDRGEIDASGTEKPPERPFYRDFAETGDGATYHAGGMSHEDLEEMLARAFGGRAAGRGGRGAGLRMRGADAHFALTVDFLDAANGARRRLVLPDGEALEVNIPAGVRDGQVLRLRGKGNPGIGGGEAGDALIEISIAPHPLFRREGDDVVIELPVTVAEAVLGAAVEVPTPRGRVRMNIPRNTSTGTRLRLKGRGIGEGHLFVEIRIVLPPEPDAALEAALRDYRPAHPFDPRAAMPGGAT